MARSILAGKFTLSPIQYRLAQDCCRTFFWQSIGENRFRCQKSFVEAIIIDDVAYIDYEPIMFKMDDYIINAII